MGKHLRRWGAVWILSLLFVGSWVGQLVFQLQVARSDAEEHGQPFSLSEFWPQFWASTFENHQSEYLQLVFQAVLILALGSKLFRADQTASTEDVEGLRTEIRMLRGELQSRLSRPEDR